MQYKYFLSLFAICISAASSACRCAKYEFLAIPRAAAPEQSHDQACSSYQLIDARGTLEPQGTSLMFQLAVQRILANTTNTTSHSVVYPAGLDQNITLGSNYLAQTIRNGLQKCPDQKYLLFGYSQGASVVLAGLQELGASEADAVMSVTLVGNPFRIPGRLSNVN